ncbi:HPF/RaiA family ribosome-associated protein [Kribbella sp. NPDC050124]|uniref:HPF/RaiA family ribosome-associated protein n=1 Tax=Kribbella sp. NPDC050124 TaxID=3364114 RepID=UPI00378D751C
MTTREPTMKAEANPAPEQGRVQVTVRGPVPRDIATYATTKIDHVLSWTPDRVQHLHVVVTLANEEHDEAAGIEVEAVVDGTPIHVHAKAPTLTEATDAATDRLRRQLTDRRERMRSRRRRGVPKPPVTTDLTE